jgi:signal transduction histidine kinase
MNAGIPAEGGGSFLPHVYCLRLQPDLIWLHVTSDAVTAIAYFMIPMTLVYFLRRMKAPLSFNWAISLFACFIVLCGTAHIFEIITLWEPMYYVQGLVKLVTALVSIVTAAAIIPLVPKLLSMRSPEELELVNHQLQDQITARAEVEQELRQSLLELGHAMNELEQFAYIASHDLQAPLRSMSGFSQLLMSRHRNKLDGDAGEFLDYIDSGARHMQALISDLLELSRVGREQDGRYQSRPLAETLDAALASLAEPIAAQHAEIVRGMLPAQMNADHALLKQLLHNLIGNAIKFHRPGVPPRIEIHTQHEGDYWHLVVADNGIGIPSEDLDHVFDIFRRLHSSTDYAGTGIGLAICRKIALYHGGSIWATSDASGTQFHVRLPIDPTYRRSASPHHPAKARPSLV